MRGSRAVPKPEKFSNEKKREWIRLLPCAVDGVYGTQSNPVDPHHMKQNRDDKWLVPLRRFPSHRHLHDLGRRDGTVGTRIHGGVTKRHIFKIDLMELAFRLHKTWEHVGQRALTMPEFKSLVDSCRIREGDSDEISPESSG